MKRVQVVAVLGLLSVSGCGGANSEAVDTTTVRDSAGIAIVENTQPRSAAGEPWQLSSEPILTIGNVEGEDQYLFHGVLGARRLGDGRIVVVNRGTSELRFFDENGRFQHSTGGEGEGPGEFRFMSLFWARAGDTLVVSDARGLSVLDGQGRFVRMVRMQAAADGRPAQPVAQLDGGAVLATRGTGSGIPPVPGTLVSDSVQFLSFAGDGSPMSPLTTVPRSGVLVTEAGGRVMPRRVPFSAGPAWAGAGESVYLADGREPQYVVMRPDGGVERIVRWTPGSLEISDDHVARYRDHALANARTDDARRELEQFLGEVTLPAYLPATGELAAILVADDGTTWVQSYRLPWSERSEWLVFSADGEWLGSVTTPARFTLHQAGSDFVLGSWRDDLGVEYVHMYGLRKGMDGDGGRTGSRQAAANPILALET